MKNAWKGLAALAVSAALVVAPLTMAGASATGWHPEPDPQCTPSDAWTETVVDAPAIPAVPEILEVSHTEYQRYSWTGGPLEGSPPNGAPGDGWTANTTNYEGAGHGTDPIGVAFDESHGSSGNADWFFWTATKVIDQPYVPGAPAVPAQTHDVEHPAVTCPPDSPTAVHPPRPVWVDECGAGNGHWTYSDVAGNGYKYVEYTDSNGRQWITVAPEAVGDGFYIPVSDLFLLHETETNTEPCPPTTVGVPTQFSAPAAAPTCDTAASFSEEDGVYEFENITVWVTRDSDEVGNFVVVEVEAHEGFTLEGLSDEWEVNEAGTYAYRFIDLPGATGETQSEDSEAPCYVAPQVVLPAPLAPTFTDLCGTANDDYAVPGNTDVVRYEVVEDGDTVTITAVPRTEGDTFPEGAESEWTFTFTNVACPAGTTPPTTAGLAATGGPDMGIWGWGAFATLIAGMTLVAYRKLVSR